MKTTLCYDRETVEEISLLDEDRFLNMMILGPTGTGKTSQIMIPLILQDILREDIGVTIFDPKEELAKKIKEETEDLIIPNKEIVYFDPTSEDCPKIDLFRGKTEEIIKNLSIIFLNNRDDVDKSENYLIRTLIDKSIRLLKEYPSICGKSLNIHTYNDFITDNTGKIELKITKIKEKLSMEAQIKQIEDCDWFLNNYYKKETGFYEKCAAFRSRIDEISSNKYLARAFVDSSSNQNILNFDKHISNGNIVIINTKNTELGYLGKIIGEILMLLYSNSVFKRFKYNENHGIEILRPNFLYIDEFSTYAPVTIELFTKARSFKIGTHIALQNRTMLSNCGGIDSKNEAFTIESNTRNLILFPGLSGEDADYYSKQFFNFSPSQILYRPFGQIIYRIVKKNNIIPPGIGLVFFLDQQPTAKSITKEYEFNEDGKIVYKTYKNYFTED